MTATMSSLEEQRRQRRREVNRYHSKKKRQRRNQELEQLIHSVNLLKAQKAAAAQTTLQLEQLLMNAKFMARQVEQARMVTPSVPRFVSVPHWQPAEHPVPAFEVEDCFDTLAAREPIMFSVAPPAPLSSSCPVTSLDEWQPAAPQSSFTLERMSPATLVSDASPWDLLPLMQDDILEPTWLAELFP